ncbi:MAG: DNA-processing protein DprA [Pseudomonadota bacterium]
MTSPIRGKAERLAAIRLARTERVGPVTYQALLSRFGSASAALDALPSMAKRSGKAKAPASPSERAVQEELDAVSAIGGEVLLIGDASYPSLLSRIEDAPPVLIVRGHTSLLSRPCIGIVGARNASLNGRKLAERLARDLGQAGFIISSGLAKGIDTAAHHGSLATGTIAAMAGGIDVVYPAENKALFDDICDQGIAVSEQRLGTETRAQLFPRRNRIISGLSRGVLVVEAARRSGSLMTARLAADQGREVLAVPGSPLDPRAGGTNQLLKDGAVLVRDVEDVLQEISPHSDPVIDQPPRLFDPLAGADGRSVEEASEAARQAVLDRLTTTPTAVDEVLRDCQLPAPEILMAVLELEIAGLIVRHPGNRISVA